MTYFADHPGLIHAVAVCCAILGLGLLLLALVAKFADWYSDRHDRRQPTKLEEERRGAYLAGRYADGLEDRMDWDENVKRRTAELEEERRS